MKHPFRTLLNDLFVHPLLDLKDSVVGAFVTQTGLKKPVPARVERDEP